MRSRGWTLIQNDQRSHKRGNVDADTPQGRRHAKTKAETRVAQLQVQACPKPGEARILPLWPQRAPIRRHLDLTLPASGTTRQ